MKYIFNLFLLSILILAFNSCEKDEGKLPQISFKTEPGYVSENTMVSAGGTVTIGTHAAKSEEEDVLKKYNISLSINGGKDSTIYSRDLTANEEDQFDFDFTPTFGLDAGVNYKFTFTVTNRDGLTNFVFLTLTTKEQKLPEIEFKTGVGYTSSDATVTAGSLVTIGIHAEKAEEEDVLKKFNVSASTDGAAAVTLEDIDLTGADGDVYDVDYTFTVPPAAGHNFKLTFTVTNRDGLTNQVALTLTAN